VIFLFIDDPCGAAIGISGGKNVSCYRYGLV